MKEDDLKHRKEFDQWVEKMTPVAEKMIRDAYDLNGAAVTGFIFSQNMQGLVRFGNVGNQGDALVNLHAILASLAADLKEQKTESNLHYAEIGYVPAPSGESHESIADALAQMVLITGMDERRVDRIMELAQRYIVTRNTNAKQTDV